MTGEMAGGPMDVTGGPMDATDGPMDDNGPMDVPGD